MLLHPSRLFGYLLDVVDPGEDPLASLYQDGELLSELSLAHGSTGVHTVHFFMLAPAIATNEEARGQQLPGEPYCSSLIV